MTRVIAIDAGQSTGVAVVDFTEETFEVVHQAQFVADVQTTAWELHSLVEYYETEVTVVEQFNLRPHNEFVADLTTVEVNGALKALWGEGNIVWQTPAQAKGLVSDKVLKNLNCWPTGTTVGQPDANDVRDALRHVFHYAVIDLKHRPTISVGWPRDGDGDD